ncbi:hypothetical protein [Helicobacter equorum]|uniref:hypothetical protein n=1 Tax=Helicobacter equorum TaxID=361872 RepID=UPI000CF111F9|nr:hypothetical protein [Helicobacter equorum]
MVVTIRVLENLTGFSIEIKNGELKILDSIVKNPHITISAPESILACIVDNNESWDEASIGYWCKFHRSPDVYHSEFWRLLQAPYFLKHKNYKSKLDSVICKETPISKILDSKSYLKVLNRYGLYCSICDKAKAETLELASLIHGLTPQNLDRMIKELNAINKI